MRRHRRASLAATALLTGATAFACEPPLRGAEVQRIEGLRHVIAWRAPHPLPLAEFFALDLAACARDGGALKPPRVDATMPEHGHGMNYRPRVTTLGAGRYRANGLLLHMPGRWRLAVAIGQGDRAETLSVPIVVE